MANSFLDRVVDVTQPAASGLSSNAVTPGAGNGANNSTNLSAILTEAVTNSPTDGFAVYFPIGLYEFPTTVTFPNSRSFRVFGGGGQVKGLSAMQSTLGACAILRWTGGATGPLFYIRDTDGDVWENLNFDGAVGPDTNASGPGDGLDALIKYERDSGSVGCLYHHFKNCGFFRTQRGFYAAGGSGGLGTAEFTFSKCMFVCGEGNLNAWTSQGFYTDNPQCVNVVFDSNCEFNNCGYCAYAKSGGRIRFESPTIAICGTILAREDGSQNTAGDAIIAPHLDGGPGSEGRKAIYASIDEDAVYGPVVIETPKFGSLGTLSNEYVTISSFVGTSLSLGDPIRMRVGDILTFFDKAAIDAGDYSGTGAVETTIATRTDDENYTTAQSATTLGITTPGNWYCANGEAFVTCKSSEFVEIRNAFLTTQLIAGGRLARMSSSVNGEVPKLVVSNSMGALAGATFDQTLLESWLSRSGTTYWRFENFAPYFTADAPQTFGNFGVASTATAANLDFALVPTERTFVLLPTVDEGLVAEGVKSFAIDSDPLIAIEFVHDMPLGGSIKDVDDPVIEAGPSLGLSFSVGHDRSQVKLQTSTDITGTYIVRQTVTYQDDSTATGRITVEVVD